MSLYFAGANDESRICKYYAAGRDCWSGENCRFEHVLRDGKTFKNVFVG